MEKVTILDVAKRANVSTSTVSRVMNNGVCNKETRNRVLQAIKDLGYSPNQSARNLSSLKFKKRVAVLIPELNNLVYMEIINGIKAITNVYGFDFTIFTFSNQEQFKKALKNISRNTEFAGVVEISEFLNSNNLEIISLFDHYFEFEINDSLANEKIYYVSEDPILNNFFTKNLNNLFTNNQDEATAFLTTTIDETGLLINNTNKPIYTLEACSHVKHLLNIKHMNIDFFTIGAILARVLMKELAGSCEKSAIKITIGVENE